MSPEIQLRERPPAPPLPLPAIPAGAPGRRRPWRRAAVVAALVLLGLTAGGLYWASSPACEDLLRRRLIADLERATGGRAEIAAFHWHLFALDAELRGLVLHGTESAGEAPYVRVERLHLGISILNLFTPHLLLRELEISRPEVHLIVYRDGTTNQPHPQHPRAVRRSDLEGLFSLHAGRIVVEQGALDLDQRASHFDFRDRRLPLDFAASDLSAVASWAPARAGTRESYHLELGARDLVLTRGGPASKPVRGYLQATVDLMRNALLLRSLRITAGGGSHGGRALEISGSVVDFTDPRWEAAAAGELDLGLLEPVTGFPRTPEGLARLSLTAEGHAGQFRLDGPLHIDRGAYLSRDVRARGLTIDARVHGDPQRLELNAVAVRFPEGGELDGSVTLAHWLPPAAGAPAFTAPGSREPAPASPSGIDGRVTAALKGVSIDTVLDVVSRPPFERLGIDGRLSGPATATWTRGDTSTLTVGATLGVSPPARPVAGERPAAGIIDGTYSNRDGTVELRNLDLALPASRLLARGRLGASPVTSPSSLDVDLRSRDLGEFDTLLRNLGLRRNGRWGAAALPASLGGEAEFHGSWTGSLVDPRLAGNLRGSGVTVEVPGHAGRIHWDTLELNGNYAAERILIDHGRLTHGPAEIAISGTLAASPGPRGRPVFDAGSRLHLHLAAARVDMPELARLSGGRWPATGELNAEMNLEGPLSALEGNGSAELEHGELMGQPVDRLRAQGRMTGRVLHLDSVALSDPGGRITGSGTLDLGSRRFEVAAQGTAIDLARVRRLEEAGLELTGSLSFSLNGSGTPEDPHLRGRGTLSALRVAGEPVGGVEIAAHTESHSLLYDLTTRFATASLAAHGRTALGGEYATRLQADFSEFNIAALLKLARVPGLTGESQLAGTVTLDGPLAHPERLRGEARLERLTATLSGVRLESQGPVHAALAGARIALDPVHITGDQTDVHGGGSIDLRGDRRLDLTASGSINLKLAETIQPGITAGGMTTFRVEAHGPLRNPELGGRIDFENASLALEELPNSLSQLNGTLEFNQNHLEVRSLTATTGGGQLRVSGYLAYQHGIFADLALSGKGVRIRYPQGVSSLADASLQLQGTQNNLLLSGDVMITRFNVSPDLDITALASSAGRVQPIAPPDAPSNHVRLDVHVQSSPQLNFQNAYAKLAGDVDLHLRGTLATPSLLGRVSITEGSATIAGTRYELERGDVTFTNPVRIEPAIDLNATARVEDYDITLGLHGSPNKMAVSYRSDPPLPEADVVALLALGRTQNEQQLYGKQQEVAAASPTTEALLGGALNASVSSRVQRLFGAGSVRVDPSYLGVLGNSTTRVTVEEQLGKNLTLTYATDVNTTAQQLLQAEVAINRHVSLLIARDESGVFSMVLKATRRYR